MTNTNDAALHDLFRGIISVEVICQGHPMSVGVSIGITHVIPGKDAVETVPRRADQALYSAKAGGRSGYRWFEERPATPSLT